MNPTEVSILEGLEDERFERLCQTLRSHGITLQACLAQPQETKAPTLPNVSEHYSEVLLSLKIA